MATTYNKIATTTLGSNTSSVTFSSITSSYTDLVISVNAKMTGEGNVYMQIGNSSVDTGSNYNSLLIYGAGGGNTALTAYSNASTQFTVGEISGTKFSANLINLMNYTSTSTFKYTLCRSIFTDGSQHSDLWSGAWRSTSAVNIIKLFHDTYSFVSGSTFTLYGIAKY